MPKTQNPTIHLDVAIIGGGIAGLWTLNKLVKQGYNAALFESHKLGSQQSICSQGMIHGGVKYTLNGAINGASEAIAEMPQYWQNCLEGRGDIDLRSADILSECFYMWSTSSLTSRLSSFFASKALRGRVDKLRTKDYPDALRHEKFSGSVYRLVDKVLDVPSLIKALAANCPQQIFKIDWSKTQWLKNKNDEVSLSFPDFTLKADQFIFTAGEGNEALLEACQCPAPQMQRRPLKQVMLKHNFPHAFYGHCLGADKTPRLTISSHPCEDGEQVWYLGGTLAEKGVQMSNEEVIRAAQQELQELIPWLKLDNAQWAAFDINRAEPKQRQLARPDQAFAERAEAASNVIVGWPTKLTLAPDMVNRVEALLSPPSGSTFPEALQSLPRPDAALSPWQVVFKK